MSQHDRTPWRVAHYVRRALAQLQHDEQRQLVDQLRMASNVLERIAALSRRLDKVHLRRWHGAAKRLTRQLHRAREEAAAELAALERVTSRPGTSVPSMHELDEELHQLDEEFGGWRYEPREHALCATTGPIELEDVALGRFEIRLRLDELSSVPHQRAYEIVALDPNPAAGSPQVTHPHVADEKLCEGEASSAIRSALSTGRLCDVFMLVRSTLEHYNPGSPYVELESWHGEPCAECGDRVDEQRSGTCRRCEAMVCDECGVSCADCGDLHCPGCLASCQSCDEMCCPGCIERCAGCGQRCCGQCVDDELCPSCHQQQEECDDEQDEHQEQRPHEQPHQPQAQGEAVPQTPAAR